jgi:hypothetical protein
LFAATGLPPHQVVTASHRAVVVQRGVEFEVRLPVAVGEWRPKNSFWWMWDTGEFTKVLAFQGRTANRFRGTNKKWKRRDIFVFKAVGPGKTKLEFERIAFDGSDVAIVERCDFEIEVE